MIVFMFHVRNEINSHKNTSFSWRCLFGGLFVPGNKSGWCCFLSSLILAGAPLSSCVGVKKRLVRLLKGSPRCLVVHGRQPEQQAVDVFSDSDWAGCVKTCRPTSSSYVMLGGNVVATSSGQSEFCALSKSAWIALGAMKGWLHDAVWAECETFILRFCGCRKRWPDES